jgi:hypothetical protein
VAAKSINGFYQLTDGRGFVNKNTKDVEWIEVLSAASELEASAREPILPPSTSSSLVEQVALAEETKKLHKEHTLLEEECSRLRTLAANLKTEMNRLTEIAPEPAICTRGQRPVSLRRRTVEQRKLTASSDLSARALARSSANLPRSSLGGSEAQESHSWEVYEERNSVSYRRTPSGHVSEESVPVATQEVAPEDANTSPSSLGDALELFQRNLRLLREHLQAGGPGYPAHVWEGEFVCRAEVTVRLDPRGDCLVFEQPARLFGLFSRADIPPLRYTDAAK